MPEENENKEQNENNKTFTQAEVDAMILKRAERVAADKYGDYADLQRKAEEFDKAAEAARTEQEKAVDAARSEGEKAANERANTRLIKAEARALAAQAGFRSLADVNLLDLSGVTVAENGDVNSDAVKAKLKELSDADPWRIDDGKKPAPKPDRSQGGGGDKSGEKSVESGRDLYAARRGKKTT